MTTPAFGDQWTRFGSFNESCATTACVGHAKVGRGGLINWIYKKTFSMDVKHA